ncbi:AAA family ATPase [Sandaracinus amylolyticus]|uniref:AAA family ATPase n=1 Tax=Sandaracinus amylolyticus TaxID=927083 RepID=UPI001F1CA92F|nr:ATP-binding protein [Sandaracinus amylolyticus]UJR85254.1 Hypothetical protein I5071_73340 [Sandaracinus amylolyticus]
MAHIAEFEIHGLAGRSAPIRKELHPKTNLFFGGNGSGKTSLLRILRAVLAEDTSSLATVPFTRAEVVVAHPFQKRSFTYSLLRNSAPRSPAEERRYDPKLFVYDETGRPVPDVSLSVQPEKRPMGWAHEYLPTTRMFFGADRTLPEMMRHSLHTEPGIEDLANRLFKDAVEREWLTLYSRSQAQVRKVQEDGLADLLVALLNRSGADENTPPEPEVSAEAAYDRAVTFLRRMRRVRTAPKIGTFTAHYERDPVLQHVMRHIDEVETKIKDIQKPIDEFRTQIDRLFSGGKKLLAGPDGLSVQLAGDRKIDISSLSSGEKQIIRLLMAAIRGDGPILIDEPELSMHINWQREFIRTMRALNQDSQIIAATHSPEILADIPDENIFRI